MSELFSRAMLPTARIIGLLLLLLCSATLAQSSASAPALAATGAAAAAAAAVPLPAPTAPATANPYGVAAVWQKGDLVAKATLLILIVMSMASWYVVVTKFVEQAHIAKQAKAVEANFWNSGSVRQSTDQLAADSPFRFVAEKALEGASRHDGMLQAVDFNTWVTLSIQRALSGVQSRLQDGLAVLATVGSTAPFVGLFGTVWGIYPALIAIGQSGQASIDKVAGPVGEALIMTAIGLAVAVPAVLGYNWLVRRNKSAMESVQAFGNDLHAVMLATAAKPLPLIPPES